MEAPSKLFIKQEQIKVEMIPGGELPNVGIQYIRKDSLVEWVKLAYGKVSMNPFDCSEAFEELINKIHAL